MKNTILLLIINFIIIVKLSFTNADYKEIYEDYDEDDLENDEFYNQNNDYLLNISNTNNNTYIERLSNKLKQDRINNDNDIISKINSHDPDFVYTMKIKAKNEEIFYYDLNNNSKDTNNILLLNNNSNINKTKLNNYKFKRSKITLFTINLSTDLVSNKHTTLEIYENSYLVDKVNSQNKIYKEFVINKPCIIEMHIINTSNNDEKILVGFKLEEVKINNNNNNYTTFNNNETSNIKFNNIINRVLTNINKYKSHLKISEKRLVNNYNTNITNYNNIIFCSYIEIIIMLIIFIIQYLYIKKLIKNI